MVNGLNGESGCHKKLNIITKMITEYNYILAMGNDKKSFEQICSEAVSTVYNSNVIQRGLASYQIYKHTNALPPTFEIGEKCGFEQFVPDPVSADVVQYHMNKIDQGKAKMQHIVAEDRARSQARVQQAQAKAHHDQQEALMQRMLADARANAQKRQQQIFGNR